MEINSLNSGRLWRCFILCWYDIWKAFTFMYFKQHINRNKKNSCTIFLNHAKYFCINQVHRHNMKHRKNSILQFKFKYYFEILSSLFWNNGSFVSVAFSIRLFVFYLYDSFCSYFSYALSIFEINAENSPTPVSSKNVCFNILW